VNEEHEHEHLCECIHKTLSLVLAKRSKPSKVEL